MFEHAQNVNAIFLEKRIGNSFINFFSAIEVLKFHEEKMKNGFFVSLALGLLFLSNSALADYEFSKFVDAVNKNSVESLVLLFQDPKFSLDDLYPLFSETSNETGDLPLMSYAAERNLDEIGRVFDHYFLLLLAYEYGEKRTRTTFQNFKSKRDAYLKKYAAMDDNYCGADPDYLVALSEANVCCRNFFDDVKPLVLTHDVKGIQEIFTKPDFSPLHLCNSGKTGVFQQRLVDGDANGILDYTYREDAPLYRMLFSYQVLKRALDLFVLTRDERYFNSDDENQGTFASGKSEPRKCVSEQLCSRHKDFMVFEFEPEKRALIRMLMLPKEYNERMLDLGMEGDWFIDVSVYCGGWPITLKEVLEELEIDHFVDVKRVEAIAIN